MVMVMDMDIGTYYINKVDGIESYLMGTQAMLLLLYKPSCVS